MDGNIVISFDNIVWEESVDYCINVIRKNAQNDAEKLKKRRGMLLSIAIILTFLKKARENPQIILERMVE